MINGKKTKKILVVDDNPQVANLCKKILENEGYEVQAITESIKALEVLKKENFNLVITDIKMPNMDGIELLKKIKETFMYMDVILMTAYATIDTAIDALRSGAYDYLLKPFKLDDFVHCVNNCIEHLQSRLNLKNA